MEDYKLDLLYYDGTKKDYTFYLNIENGTISETQNVSPIVGSWVYITDEGYKEIITFYSDNTGRWESVNIHDNTFNLDPFTYTMMIRRISLLLILEIIHPKRTIITYLTIR